MINTLLRLWRNIELKFKFQLAALTLLLVINATLEVISIGSAIPFLAALTSFDKIYVNQYFRIIFDLFGITSPNQALGLFAFIFGVSIAITCFVRILTLYLTTKISFNIGTEIGIKIYSKILNQKYLYHIQNNSSVLLNSIILNSDRTLSVINSVLIILSSSIILLAAIIMLTIINWKVTLISLLSFTLAYLAVTFLIKKKLQLNGLIVNLESTNVIKCLQEGLGGIRDVIVNNSFDAYIKNYKKFEIPKREALASNIMLGNLPKLILESVGMILIVLVGYYLFVDMNGSIIVFPILAVIALTAQRLLPIMQQIYLAVTTIISNHASLENTLEILNFNNQYTSYEIQSEKFITFDKHIKLKEIYFRYLQPDKYILKDVNLCISKGSRIGFIGKTGGGKSTLTDILMGLLEPTSGQILIDGVPLRDNNIRSWMGKISHVPQDIYLLDASILENIAFGVEESQINIQKVIEVTKKANIYNEIINFQKGFNTIIGERGTKLSGGQKQRIAIARALYRKCEVLILDEATSALDLETETSIIDALANIDNQITIIMITHRLTTLKSCSHIYSLNDSQIYGPLIYEDLAINLNSRN